MPVETDADRLLFLGAGDFGTTATWSDPDAATPVSIAGILSNRFVEAAEGGVAPSGVGTTEPYFLCRTSDVADIEEGALLEIDGVDYQVAGVPEHDGTGMTRLNLVEVD